MLVNVLFVVLFAAALAKKDAPNYIVSFPKVSESVDGGVDCGTDNTTLHKPQSGRTWLRLMIGYAIDE